MWWLTCVLCVLCNVELSQALSINENNSISCVVNILKKYTEPKSELTIVTIDNNANEILAALHSMKHNIVYLRTRRVKNKIPHNNGYLIIANSSREFAENFEYITKEGTWNPYSKMLILIRYLERGDLKLIFDILLKVHVLNVVVINSTNTADLYTYNPFENYNCGRRYDRVISLGLCKKMHNFDVFYYKFVTGLRNCTIRITYSPLPPHVFDPTKTDEIGLEQFVMNHISEKEKFHIDSRFRNDADEFSTILNNTIAVGALRALQTNKTDIVIGSMLLTAARAEVFTFLAENSVTIDYLAYQVPTARQASSLENIYLEFQGLVWLALSIAFVVYSLLIFLAMKEEFSCTVLLKLFGYLVLQSNNIVGKSKSNSIVIFWIFFAYIINCYYQSSLVSLIANPIMEYQINSEADIENSRLKPCVCKAVRRVMHAIAKKDFLENEDELCDKSMKDSVRVVAEERSQYTITLLSVYEYHKSDFYDDDGKLAVHSIIPPISQVIYACYMYKGFPMPERIQQRYFQLGEAGLISQQFAKLKMEKKKQYAGFKIKNQTIKFFIPWSVLIAGVFLSLFTFIVELMIHKLVAFRGVTRIISDIPDLVGNP